MQMSSGVLRRACALVVAALVGTSILVVLPGAAGAIPPVSDRFSCGAGSYFRLANGTVTQFNDLFAGAGGSAITVGFNVNAMGYRNADRYLYGIRLNSNKVVRVTANGGTELGAVTGLPVDTYVAAAIDAQTGVYYVSNGPSMLYSIDIDSLTAASVTVPGGTFPGIGTDFVIMNGWLWTVRGGRLAGFQLSTGTWRFYNIGSSLVTTSTATGALWNDASGTIYAEIAGASEVLVMAGAGGASITSSKSTPTFTTTAPIDGATCSKSLLTATPDAKSRTYGEAAPSYTSQSTGFLFGEDASTASGYVAPGCTSAYTSTTAVSAGPLTISCSGGSADNYTFDTSATAALTIAKKSLTVTPDAKSRTFGDAAPTYTFQVTGFVSGEDASTAAGYVAPVCGSSYTSTTAVSASPLTITCSGGSADDYTFDTSATASLTISYPLESVDCAAGSNFRLGRGVLSSGSSFLTTWNTIATYDTKKMWNAVAVRPADRRLYGFRRGLTNQLSRGGIFGASTLGVVTGLPRDQYLAADFDPQSGLMYVYSAKTNRLFAIDVDSLTATAVSTPNGYRIGYDMVITGGDLWTYSNGFISRLRLSNGSLASWPSAPGVSPRDLGNRIVGSMYFDSSSNTIYGEITSTGKLLAFTGIGTGNVTTSPVGASSGGSAPIDGGFCR